MKKLSILTLACFFAVTATANAQLIAPMDEPALISGSDMSILLSDYDPAMAWAFENNVLTGDELTGDLREDDCVRRAELLKMLYNVLEVNTANANAELFSDTFADQWYVDYVKKAREKGTVVGYPDGTFQPGACVNRAEAIKIALLEFPNLNPVGSPIDYTDVPESEWYYQYVSYAVANNLVGLKHAAYSTNFWPGNPMARNEFAEMLYRLKAVEQNNLDSYESDYWANNLEAIPVQNYDLEPEEFFEFKTEFLLTLDTANQNQVNILDGYLANTPAVSVDELINQLLESIAADVDTAFGDGTKVLFGAGESGLESILFTVQDPVQLEFAFENLAKQEGYSQSTLFGFKTFDNRVDGTFYAYTDKVMATWPTPGDRYMALQKIYNGEQDLLDNAEYTDYLSSVPAANVGTIYFHSPISESGMLAVVPNSYGIKFYYRINYGEGLFSAATEPPYMYKNLPGNDLLMYGEASGLLDFFASDGTDVASELQSEGMITTAAEWMNQGYAFAMHDTGALLPGMALYFDAAGYVSQAQDDIAAMNEFFEALIAQMNEESSEMADVVVKDTVSVDGRNLNRITLDLNAVPQEELDPDLEMFSSFVPEPIEFYYGLTSDNYVVFALYSGFNSVYGQTTTVSANVDVKAGLQQLIDYPNGLSYVSFENILSYVDMWVAEIEKTDPMPTEMKDSYNEVMDYLSVVKYLINSEKDPGTGVMFVKVN